MSPTTSLLRLLVLSTYPPNHRHRVFAELLEQGTRSTLKIPSAYPTPTPSAALMAAQALEASQMGLDAMRVLGLNPNQALQHPGFYYYMAARCTERRRERFLSVLEAGVRPTATTYVVIHADLSWVRQGDHSSPGFVNERKVDHLTIVLEVCHSHLGCVVQVWAHTVLAHSSTPAHTSSSRSGARRTCRTPAG